MNTNNKHKYRIGELLMCYAGGVYAGSKARRKVFGVVSAYEDRYYIVCWYDTVPSYYTGILSEGEIETMHNNITREMER